jgi:dimethylglycine dehydrogenase
MFVAGVPALVNRLSFTGELGYEMYVAPHYQLKLYEAIEEAGKQFNIKPFGGRALMSMRLEKNWGAWTLDFRPDFTPKETGLSSFINWDKDFIGKDAADKDGSNHKLFSLVIETDDIDVTNNEAVMQNDVCIGYVTSGGFGHYVQKSIAFAYLNNDLLKTEEVLQVEINGDFYNALIIDKPCYDESGKNLRQ